MVWDSISALAIYFVIWWTVLFAILPFSLRTQDEERDVVLGTEASAPREPRLMRAALRTTLVSCAVFAALYWLFYIWGFSFDDLPAIVPDFGLHG